MYMQISITLLVYHPLVTLAFPTQMKHPKTAAKEVGAIKCQIRDVKIIVLFERGGYIYSHVKGNFHYCDFSEDYSCKVC